MEEIVLSKKNMVDVSWYVSVNRKHPERRKVADVRLSFVVGVENHTYQGIIQNPWSPETKPLGLPSTLIVEGWKWQDENPAIIKRKIIIPPDVVITTNGLSMKQMESQIWRGKIVEDPTTWWEIEWIGEKIGFGSVITKPINLKIGGG